MAASVQRSNLPPATSTTAAATPGASIPYVLTGPIAVLASPAVTPHLGTTITGFSATLETAGTTATTIELLVNNSVVATLIVPANKTYAYIAINPNITLTARQDNYSVSVTAAGSGAANLGGEIEILATA